MKKFQFKFETVEKVRKTREDEALRLLAQAQRVFQQARNHKERLVNDLNEALLRRELLAKEVVTVVAFFVEEDFITGTKQRIVYADQAILRAKRGVEKAIRFYLYARRQTRTIEILREKAYEEYKQQTKRQEQKEINDLHVMRARLNSEEAA